ncbi:Pectin lyase-like superfamily protein [Perilla frutescens var. hirtella]|uniref:Pectin lyase-like superfamily protein n=1 Tax=Perilla frutescens var. hirtella TaxID=608512 RepID=A0AAD4NXF2_PERFH|nr:Pectin lyase-like superfamily protein [Perilla frutescens var. hirtella]KAH6815941.1 Pectin lyase-like superfamily protein [Perilla frutescens var. frutescens]
MAKFAAFFQIFFLVSTATQICIATSYNVIDFGARPDGKTDSTSAFTKAWTVACNSKKKTTVLVPPGRFLVNSITFNGPCKNEIKLRILGTIVAPSYEYFLSHQAWIEFFAVNRLSIVGGTIDAKGSSYWSCKRGGNNCPFGARSLSLQSCNDVFISGLKSLNSQGVHVNINGCNNVTMQRLRIIAPGDSPNTDGIHIGNSNFFKILNSTIATGDDCISIGPGSTYMRMEKINCGPGHGISIGSMGGTPKEDGVHHIVVTNSVFTRTDNGVRIKTWAKPFKSFAEHVVFKNLEMRNVSNPIIIDQEYCPQRDCPISVNS